MAQSVFFFGNGKAEGTRDMTNVLGGKGANLAEMTNLGVPVPQGFTIACSECIEYLKTGKYSDKLRAEVEGNIARLEKATGKKLGDPKNPLLVSVRSGASVSMPGMMETILNLGLNDRTAQGLAKQSKNPRFAYDSYRRFIQMYSDVVLGVSIADFEHLLKARRLTTGAQTDADLSEETLRNLVEEYKALVRNSTHIEFPTNPVVQLWGAIEAVWKSWTLKKARDYRKVNNIPEDLGTGVNVVAMVFGNLGDDSGTGVAFTRNPSTGEKRFYGEFLVNAQGEDVVAGTRTPLNIDEMAERLPGAYKELLDTQDRLEQHYHDMQDLEFTVERGKLYLLQTRNGKRTAAAAVRIARDMVKEGLIDKTEAVKRVPPADLDQLLHPIIDPSVRAKPLCIGLPASPGAASGIAVFDPDSAVERAAAGDAVILVRDETTPEDFHGIVAARAVLTARGGMTSHAAVVARGMGKCAIVGCKDIEVDLTHRRFAVNGTLVGEGEWLTLDGATGRVFAGNLPTIPSEVVQVTNGTLPRSRAPLYQSYSELLDWADDCRRLKVRANADTPRDARIARSFGAEGIGLCRTEHMFFEGDRITAMREMIVAREEGGRRRARQAAADAASGFRGNLRGDGRPAGDDPASRSAAARVSSARRRGEQAPGAYARASPRGARAHRRGPQRKQPDVGPPRLPSRHHVPRNHGNAGPGDLRSRSTSNETWNRRTSGDHGSTRLDSRGIRESAVNTGKRGRAGAGRNGRNRELHDRNDDRAPASRPDRR